MIDLQTTELQTRPLTELAGTIPTILTLLALIIGVSCLLVRKKTWIQSAFMLELAIAASGLSITFWRLFSSNIIFADGTAPDPSGWFFHFATSWTAAASTLAGVAIGLSLISLSWLFHSQPTKPTHAHTE